VTSLGSAIFAFLAAGTFSKIEEAQAALCPPFITVEPEPAAVATYSTLFGAYRKLYFAFGQKMSRPVGIGDVLPMLRAVANQVRGGESAASAAE
jgi:L-ribulokinase